MMSLAKLFDTIRWDMRINRGASWDSIRAKLLLVEVRLEQFWYGRLHQNPTLLKRLLWLFIRGMGSIFQWFLCNSNIPGTIMIGRGLRLPHPQNIILAGYADIGEFCTIYHNVSIAWNGFKKVIPGSPKIGDMVLIGAGAVIVGDLTIGSEVLIGAGTVVATDVPDHSRVTGGRAQITERRHSNAAAVPGSDQHLQDPYAIWR